MMSAKFSKRPPYQNPGRLYTAGERVFKWILGLYPSGLTWVLRYKPLTLGVTIATACLSVILYIIVPKGFFPQQDTGRMAGGLPASQDIFFTALPAQIAQFVGLYLNNAALAHQVGLV